MQSLSLPRIGAGECHHCWVQTPTEPLLLCLPTTASCIPAAAVSSDSVWVTLLPLVTAELCTAIAERYSGQPNLA